MKMYLYVPISSRPAGSSLRPLPLNASLWHPVLTKVNIFHYFNAKGKTANLINAEF